MTYNILHIDSSPMGENSYSRRYGAKLVAELVAKHPGAKVTHRDLAVNPLPHLTAAVLGAFFTPPEKRDAAQAAAVKPSDEAIDELFAADVIVVGSPMWNFGIPSVLKAWIDHISRAGRTFKYTETGPVGLVTGKKVIIVSSRGGVYSAGPMVSFDHQESYLKSVFPFIGITDIEVIRTEGVAMGEEPVKNAIAAADAALAQVVQKVA